MPRGETSMGGAREAFPETAWATALSSRDAPGRERALNRLFAQYWRPVYRFIRASWGKSVEDAKDLTQEFFCRIVEDGLVDRYQPAQGRFRHFLKGAVRNFVAEAHRAGLREKRGGGRTIVSLDDAELETERFLADEKARPPEDLFDRQWARDVMQASLARLRADLAAEGKETHWCVYEAYDLAEGAPPTYGEIAARFGLPATQIVNYLHHVRQRLRGMVLETIAATVSSREEALDELETLFPS